MKTKRSINKMGNEQLTPFEIAERKRLIQEVDRTSQERYLADAKKGANQEYYYAERELKDFNRKLRERGVKV
jgi:phosphoglycerol transferase MdoB-like AlkP superfamily enzyme